MNDPYESPSSEINKSEVIIKRSLYLTLFCFFVIAIDLFIFLDQILVFLTSPKGLAVNVPTFIATIVAHSLLIPFHLALYFNTFCIKVFNQKFWKIYSFLIWVYFGATIYPAIKTVGMQNMILDLILIALKIIMLYRYTESSDDIWSIPKTFGRADKTYLFTTKSESQDK